MLELIVEPRVTKTREQFQEEAPSHAIALDGYVLGAPIHDMRTKHFNFNHHEEVNRLMTRATAAQVGMAIKMGFMEAIMKKGIPTANIYVNDPDQDTCLSVRLLRNHGRISGTRSEPLINKLIDIQDKLDTTAGFYPFEGMANTLNQFNRVFEPYTNASINGSIKTMDTPGMSSLIEAVCARIGAYTTGNAKELEGDGNYERIGGGKGREMIIEKGVYARNLLSRAPINGFVSYRGEKNGRHYYSIGKKSPFTPFPLFALFDHLNMLEQDETRGGSDTIGGCRNKGSRLAPTELEIQINDFLKK